MRGRDWYESLRPHLSDDGMVDRVDTYGATAAIADEIAMIEREWGLV